MSEHLNSSQEQKPKSAVLSDAVEKNNTVDAKDTTLIALESERSQLLHRYQPIKAKLEAEEKLSPEEEVEMADIADNMHRVAGAIAEIHAREDSTLH